MICKVQAVLGESEHVVYLGSNQDDLCDAARTTLDCGFGLRIVINHDSDIAIELTDILGEAFAKELFGNNQPPPKQ